jgi:hypothetical protein
MPSVLTARAPETVANKAAIRKAAGRTIHQASPRLTVTVPDVPRIATM